MSTGMRSTAGRFCCNRPVQSLPTVARPPFSHSLGHKPDHQCQGQLCPGILSHSRCRRINSPGHSGSVSSSIAAAAALRSSAAAHAENYDHRGDLQALLQQIPYKKLLIWALVMGSLYTMKDFFGIAMGTFIMAFIGNGFVESTRNWTVLEPLGTPAARRRFMVVVYFLTIVALITSFGVLTIPDIVREGADFVQRLQSDNIWVVLVEKIRSGCGDQVMDSLERLVYLATSNDLRLAAVDAPLEWTVERSTQLGLRVASMLKGYTTTAATITAALLKSVTKFAVQVGVSLVLSFMFVWDLPRIANGVASLQSSRVAAIHQEVAPVLSVFGKLFGRALEAQARIAFANTLLTAAGMWVLAIPGIGLLSLFVFICSFIPIAGCIISTIPIGFVALTEYGFIKLALVIIMVIMVHFVEAYFLNPAIYSAHLKLHPLLVLSVLVVAEHNIGIWGLLLAVPLTVFALDYCIRYPDSSVTEVGERELEKVMHGADDDDEEPVFPVRKDAPMLGSA